MRPRAMYKRRSTRLAASFPPICRAIPVTGKSIRRTHPFCFLALTSDTMTVPQMYDAADSVLAQKLSQVQGVGQVFVWGRRNRRCAPR